MAFDPTAYFKAQNDEEDRIETKRSDKAKAYREYVDSQVKNGEHVDPLALDRMRMEMVGGDPYLATYIPSGQALQEMAKQANNRSALSRLQIGAEKAQQRGVERDYVQKIIEQNWDKSESDMAEIFGGAFGEDGVRLYDQYKPELPGMLSQATNKKYAELAQNPASKMVRSEDDLYRFFPAEMRNPRTAAILKTMAQDNMRGRNQENANISLDMMNKTPDFVKNNPSMQGWWTDFVAKGQGYNDAASSPDRGAFVGQGVTGISIQADNEAHAKLSDLASKDPYFMAASQTGDEDAIFESVKSLMVQSGMMPPTSKTDPKYLAAQKTLGLISRTNALGLYNKRESELKASLAEEAQALATKSGARFTALSAAYFAGEKYSNGKTGKDFALKDGILQAINMIGTDPNFFPSEENIQAALATIRTAYDTDPESFNPAAVVGEFMESGGVETRSDWVNRRAQNVLEAEHKFKPGTDFTVEVTERSRILRENMLEAIKGITRQPADENDYQQIMEGKAVTLQALRSEVQQLKSTADTLNNDPAQRANLLNFDYNHSMRSIRTLEDAIRAVESLSPPPPPRPEYGTESGHVSQFVPFDEQYYQDQQNLYGPGPDYPDPRNQYPGTGGFNPVEPPRYEPVNFSPSQGARPPTSRMDTYLDTIADVESGGDPFARAQTSSATGLYQFTKGTWKNMVARYGEQSGVTIDDIYDPRAQRIMAGFLTMENANQLIRSTGRQPNEADLYLAHFLGPARAATVINNQGTNLLAANLFPDAARANRNIFYRDGVPVTIEDLYKRLGRKVTKNMNKSVDA